MSEAIEAVHVDGQPTYPFVRREVVRFNDCDPLGHANNALYSTYLEQARMGILGDLSDFILARVEIDFRSPVQVGDKLRIQSRCANIGSASFVLEHRITCGDRLVAEALSTMVSYDYGRTVTTPVPASVIERLGCAHATAVTDGAASGT